MKSQKYLVLRTLWGVLAFAIAIHAESPEAQEPAGPSHPIQTASAKPHSTELAEADELIRRVVKLYSDRKYEEALPLAKRALQIREKALSADDQLVRVAQVNLAEVYIALQKYRDAKSPLDRAIKSYRNANPDDVRLGDTLERMALVEYAVGNPGKTESAYEEALRIREKIFGVGSVKTAETLLMLGEFHQLQGNDEKAATFFHRLISAIEKGSGPNQKEQLIDAIARYVCVLGKLRREEESDKWQARLSSLQGPVLPTGVRSDTYLKGGILNGKAISLPKPFYPPEARFARASGTVVVQVWIDETGHVLRACAVSGPPQLRRVSELAAYGSRFSPTKLSGQPVKVTGIITYNFVLM